MPDDLESVKRVTVAQMKKLAAEFKDNAVEFEEGCAFSKGALDHLCLAKTLQFVHFVDSKLTPADLRALSKIPRIQRVSLERCQVSDAAILELAEAKSLKWLWIEDTPIGDAGVQAIATLPDLQDVILKGTKTSDKGVAALANLSKLKELDLRSTKVSDAGLIALAGLKKLSVDVEGSKVTEEGLRAFHEAQRSKSKQKVTKATKTAGGTVDADEADVDAAKDRLLQFLKAQNTFEKQFFREYAAMEQRCRQDPACDEDVARKAFWKEQTAMARRVLEEHVSPTRQPKKPWKPGPSSPPTFNAPTKMRAESIERINRNKLAIYTNKWHIWLYQFVLIRKNNEWYIDAVKYFDGGWKKDPVF